MVLGRVRQLGSTGFWRAKHARCVYLFVAFFLQVVSSISSPLSAPVDADATAPDLAELFVEADGLL